MPDDNGDNVVMTLVFHRDTLELDIDAPEINLDFALTMIERAKRLLDDQHQITRAQAISSQVRQSALDQMKTERLLSKVKLQ